MSPRIGVPFLDGIRKRLRRLKEHLLLFLIETGIVEGNGDLVCKGSEESKILLIEIGPISLVDCFEDSDHLLLYLTGTQMIFRVLNSVLPSTPL